MTNSRRNRITPRAERRTPDLLECGHPPMPSDGMGTGYARDPKTNDRRCCPCADAWQRKQMQSADGWSGYIGYVGDDRKRFATWTGGVLGEVTRYETEERDRYTPSGGRYRNAARDGPHPRRLDMAWARQHRDGRDHDPARVTAEARQQRSEGFSRPAQDLKGERMFTVCILEPCCTLTEPGCDPGPRPVWNRSVNGWPPRCGHPAPRVATLTTHERQGLAEAWFNGRARGWYSTDGWLFEGAMPTEGQRLRIMPILGSLTTHFEHSAPFEISFPTIEMAREYAQDWHEYPDGERRKEILFNIVGDQDTIVRWSSYTVEVGTELEAGAYA
ncbi:hypothetical protein [Streptomyces sp. A5-4]|uniref:hypothetical protein n=1 Tax=Streptomyces sp. A5-4 TaxID=3384771 RepID=UPI003DA8E60D